MKARLYQCADGFEVVNCAGELFKVTESAGGVFLSRSCGVVSSSWQSGGRLLHSVPNRLKSLYFQLLKKS